MVSNSQAVTLNRRKSISTVIIRKISKQTKKALTFMTITSVVQQCCDYVHHQIAKVSSSVVIELRLLDYIVIWVLLGWIKMHVFFSW